MHEFHQLQLELGAVITRDDGEDPYYLFKLLYYQISSFKLFKLYYLGYLYLFTGSDPVRRTIAINREDGVDPYVTGSDQVSAVMYGGFQGGPQLGLPDAERRQSLGQL